MKFIIRPEADRDIFKAYDWYEGELTGLGRDFLDILEQQFSRIFEEPRAYPEVHPRLRRSLTPRFPYAIFYLLREDAVVVLAVLNQAQDPDHWKSRL